ncbi:hypothetical protein SeLEV6574_g06476 [Synchytrium endobioticum]|uniref:AB hydrolase-1 domain-containing protein n=1 Tax=Synchytrium endobioticum TaxID=286115 RepID=A0A507CNH5_9FUNG|nr:hypothetical protein SeLEV6574_g06476 [Synchytrium endobioticum]
MLSTVPASAVDLRYRLHQQKSPDARPPKISPVIILHGLLGSKRNWATLADTIATDYCTPVYAVDLRNHGESPHSPVHSLAAMSADVKLVAETLKLSSVTVIGHSMGAKAAMLFALQHPKLVSRLVIVDASPLGREPKAELDVIEQYMIGLEKVIESRVTSNQAAEDILLTYAPVRTVLSPGFFCFVGS